MIKKSDFVRSLQHEQIGLGPYEVSQRLRVQAGCMSVYQGDSLLAVEDYRGYMVRLEEKPDRTAADPELYICVISLDQSKQWQDLVWTKEIFGVLDGKFHRTSDKASLGHMMGSRRVSTQPANSQHSNVAADLNGLTLAMGCMIPKGYRDILRGRNFADQYDLQVLEATLGLPAEFVPQVLHESFEGFFEAAINQCDTVTSVTQPQPSDCFPKSDTFPHPWIVE